MVASLEIKRRLMMMLLNGRQVILSVYNYTLAPTLKFVVYLARFDIEVFRLVFTYFFVSQENNHVKRA